MAQEEIKAKAEECCITEDEVRGFCRGAWWIQQQQPNWIPTTKEHPTEGIHVFVSFIDKFTKAKGIEIGYYYINEWRNRAGVRIDNVTHWMPFPEPPK